MNFSWNNFFAKFHFHDRSFQDWERILPPQRQNDMRFAVQFLYLAYMDGTDQNQHNADGEYFQRYQLPGTRNEYGHNRFGRTPESRESLRRGLEALGAELLTARIRNGRNNQYLRTLRRYSGSMYVRLARLFSEIVQASSWNRVMEPEYLDNNNRFQRELERYFGRDEEGLRTKHDLVVFFQTLARRYRRYNRPFTRADVQDIVPVMDAVADRIISEMCAQGRREDLENLDTLPVLSLSSNGTPVYVLPRQGHFGADVEHVSFLFKESTSSHSEIATAHYRKRQDGSFILECEGEQIRDGVPVAGVGAIIRRRNVVHDDGWQDGRRTIEEDVIPLYVKDTETRHVLLRLREAQTRCGYALDTNIGSGGIVSSSSRLSAGRYKVVSFEDEILPISFFNGDKRLADPAPDAETFTLPANVDLVRIGSVDYHCLNIASSYFNVEARSHVVKNPGARLFFADSTYPFTEEFQNARLDGLSVRYILPNGQTILLQAENENWIPPVTCLWQRGWVAFFVDGTESYRRAVTFIEEPLVHELEQTLDLEASQSVTARFSTGTVPLVIPPRCTKVEFNFEGVSFVLPVKRSGVYFDCTDYTLPIRVDREGCDVVTKIAVRDFEKKCHVLSDENQEIFVTRGVNSFVHLDDSVFTGAQLRSMQQLQNDDSNQYCICVIDQVARTTQYYKFEVFDPSREYVDQRWPSRVKALRDKDDLVISYCIAISDRDAKKSLAFYPAHRQDSEIVWLEPSQEDTLSSEIAQNGVCIETLRLSSFFQRKIEWGEGLLCYVGCRNQLRPANRLGFNIETFTSGFFLPRPDGVAAAQLPDDPSGIRTAMANKNHHQIEQILTDAWGGNDETIRHYLYDNDNGFLKRLQFESGRVKAVPVDGLKVSGRHFMNAYRNLLPRRDGGHEISGYAFAAHEYYAQQLDRRGRLPEGLRDCWSPLMFTWDELRGQNLTPRYPNPIIPSAAQLDYLPLCDKKKFRTMVEKVTGRSAERGDFFYCEQGFNCVRFSEAVRKKVAAGITLEQLYAAANRQNPWARHYLQAMYEAWSHVDTEEDAALLRTRLRTRNFNADLRILNNRPQFEQGAFLRNALGKYEEVPYPVAAGYSFRDAFPLPKDALFAQKSLSDDDVSRFVRRCAEFLFNWRENPSLENAQCLREILLEVHRFDNCIKELFDNGTLTVAPGQVQPSLTQSIDIKAWQMHEQNANANV